MGIREEKKRATREKLLEAAAQCFSESGFAATSVGEIARRAGVSHGTLYVHFADKQALIKALVRLEYQGAIAAYTALPKGCALSEVLDLLCRCIAEVGFPIDHRLWISILAEVPHNPALASLQARLDGEMRAALAAAFIRAGALSVAQDAGAALILIYAMIDGLIARKAAQPAFDLSEVLPGFRRAVRQTLMNG